MTSVLLALLPPAAALVAPLLTRPLVTWIETRGHSRCLRIALRDTTPDQRAEIIRALREPR